MLNYQEKYEVAITKQFYSFLNEEHIEKTILHIDNRDLFSIKNEDCELQKINVETQNIV